MNENNQLKAFIAFLFIFSVMALSQTVSASVAVTPTIFGYAQNAATGNYLNNSVGAGQALFDQAARAYGTTGNVNIGGKPLAIPAKLPLVSNAAELAKNAMRLNPYAIVGTLAAGYLLDLGLEYLDGQWNRNSINGYSVSSVCPFTNVTCGYVGPLAVGQPYTDAQDACVANGGPSSGLVLLPDGSTYVCIIPYSDGTPGNVPFPDSNWPLLPDPLPVVAPELPYAPYMPSGAPVGVPQYQSGNYPVGEPYKSADGSTKQTMANVTSNTTNNSVTVNTYEITIINSSGVPVPSPSPEPSQTQSSECEKNPKAIGCSEYGTPPAPESLTTLTVPVNPDYSAIGGAGSCPADVTTSAFGLTFSYQPICDFASAIKPFVLGFAWLSFAFIVAGTVRT